MAKLVVTGVPYGEYTATVEGEFEEVHEIIAGIEELNRDVKFLRDQGVKEIAAAFRVDEDGNKYLGWKDRHSRKSITFIKPKKSGAIPYVPGVSKAFDPEHPKFYDPDARARPARGDGHLAGPTRPAARNVSRAR